MHVAKGSPRSDVRQLCQLVIVPIGIVIASTAFILAFSLTLTSGAHFERYNIFCKPDGTPVILLHYQIYDSQDDSYIGSTNYVPAWDPSLFLNVVFGVGELSFSAAKSIDFCWDLIVGRGGQAALAVFAYHTVRRSLVLTMEDLELGLPAVASTLTGYIGLATLWRTVVQRFDARKSVQRCIAWRMTAIAFVCCYVMMFASMASIITGYQAVQKPYVQEPGTQSLVPTDEIYIPDLVVIDGGRIGLHSDYATLYYHNGSSGEKTSIAEYYDLSHRLWRAAQPDSPSISIPDSTLQCANNDCSFDVNKDELFLSGWEAAAATNWRNRLRLQNETLDLTGWLSILRQYTDDGFTTLESNFHPPNSFGHGIDAMDWRAILRFSIAGIVHDAAWVERHTICQTLNAYRWGFSSLLVFTFGIVTLLFTLALAFLQAEVYLYSRVHRSGSESSLYHDILAFAEELQIALSGHSQKWSEMTGPALEIAVKDARVSIKTKKLPHPRREQLTLWWKEYGRDSARLEKEAEENTHAVRQRIISDVQEQGLPLVPEWRYAAEP